jgi:hypothetical protein
MGARIIADRLDVQDQGLAAQLSEQALLRAERWLLNVARRRAR